MTSLPAPTKVHTDLTFVKLAREIAIDHFELEELLKRYQITNEEWLKLKEHPRFQQLLASEIEAWQSATNTVERTKLKTAAMLEEWLPTANADLHDRTLALPGRVELAKALAKMAGIGERIGGEGVSGEKFTITINLGADSKLQFDKDKITSKVIDAEVVQETPNGSP